MNKRKSSRRYGNSIIRSSAQQHIRGLYRRFTTTCSSGSQRSQAVITVAEKLTLDGAEALLDGQGCDSRLAQAEQHRGA